MFNRVPRWRTAAWSIAILAALLAAEFVLRAFGLHTPVLYETTSYGYRAKPNQDLRRFGNRVFYDSRGLRSEPVTSLPADGVFRVLCIGDSIVNGGAVTDQDDTWPYQLQRLLGAGGKRVEVLNASAPGWAIPNEAGWLREHGTFGSHVVLLTVGTHDLYQPAARAEVVDDHPSFRSQPPRLALGELVMHYFLRRLLNPVDEHIGRTFTGDRPQAVTGTAIEQVLAIFAQSHRQGAHLALLLVEQPATLEPTDPRTVADKATLAEVLRARGIAFTNTRGAMEQAGGDALFRDGLHPNADGNRVLARIAASLIAPRLAANDP